MSTFRTLSLSYTDKSFLENDTLNDPCLQSIQLDDTSIEPGIFIFLRKQVSVPL